MLINIHYNDHAGSADNGGDSTDNEDNAGSDDNMDNDDNTDNDGAGNNLRSLDMPHIDLVVVCPYEIPPLHF
jgi:hypothetical protein